MALPWRVYDVRQWQIGQRDPTQEMRIGIKGVLKIVQEGSLWTAGEYDGVRSTRISNA